MKTLLFIAVVFFASCSGEDSDPKPNCDQMQKDMQKAHSAWQGFLDTPLNPNQPQKDKDAYFARSNELKEVYIEKTKTYNSNCK